MMNVVPAEHLPVSSRYIVMLQRGEHVDYNLSVMNH